MSGPVPGSGTIAQATFTETGLDAGEKIRLANELTRFSLSQILHGEQGALSLSASLCHVLWEPGAQEYAANQTREEARHVHAFSRYIATRWGTPLPVGRALGSFMGEIVIAPEVYKKLVGMQLIVEGFAMGAFATIHSKTHDPLLRRVIQLVMADEAFPIGPSRSSGANRAWPESKGGL